MSVVGLDEVLQLRNAESSPSSPISVPLAQSLYHPVLSHSFSRVFSLRDFFLHRLSSSRAKQRVRNLSCDNAAPDQHALAILLDAAVVGVNQSATISRHLSASSLKNAFALYLQSQSQVPSQESNCDQYDLQSQHALDANMIDIVNFCLLTLFQESQFPNNILTLNLQRIDIDRCLNYDITGIIEHFPSGNIKLLKNSPWSNLPALLGPGAAEILADLLIHQSLFTPNDDGVLVQISDVLNRYPNANCSKHTIHILKHIFPRAFGLHNVFTSVVDRRATTAQFMDYTMRDAEIFALADELRRRKGVETNTDRVPRRLRGVLPLVSKLQQLHGKCAYRALLMKYCPAEPLPRTYDPDLFDMTRLATPPESVSLFAQSVLKNILPHELFGHGEGGIQNQRIIMRYVDVFIKLRRFESLSLHTVSQGVQIGAITWLAPPKAPGIVSASDLRVRTELLQELLYYIFDSLLIPLIRSNFYVTESSSGRNRLFYFRHDVWRLLVQPHMSRLRTETFEEIPKFEVNHVLNEEAIGLSTLRIIPKKYGARPLMNLRRRPMVHVIGSNGRRETRLGPSINYMLKPLFEILNYEKNITLGVAATGSAAIGNVTEIYPRLKAFREKVAALAGPDGKLPKVYFVKLDVHSCFDSIPQENLMALISKIIPREEVYHIANYDMLTAPPRAPMASSRSNIRLWSTAKLRRRTCHAVASCDGYGGLYSANRVRRSYGSLSLVNSSSSSGGGDGGSKVLRGSIMKRRKRRNTIFVPRPARQGAQFKAETLLDLLARHVKANLVRVGKKYYRQRHGIPQGSVVSSLLCNLFYADHERKCLNFLLRDGESKRNNALLLRMIDDYLLITTDKGLAVRFLHEMLVPNEEYGITVNPEKTLVNFKVQIDGVRLPQHGTAGAAGEAAPAFPFCGTTIDTKTLALSRDSSSLLTSHKKVDVGDLLTVEMNQTPGRTFFRKMLHLFKLATMTKCPMFLDVEYNGKEKVLSFVQQAIKQAANKMLVYEKTLRKSRKVSLPSSTRDANARSKRRTHEFFRSPHLISGVTSRVLQKTVRAIIDCAVHTITGYNNSVRHGEAGRRMLHRTANAVTSSSSSSSSPSFETSVVTRDKEVITPGLIRWLAMEAFLEFLEQHCRGQNLSRFKSTIEWLRVELKGQEKKKQKKGREGRLHSDDLGI
ncbi:hypothetical protein KEM54_000833 [Ascosphaera aggregata]|nr:hypothetical protein KEM54_000833 [Ascosphaera aggregata]